MAFLKQCIITVEQQKINIKVKLMYWNFFRLEQNACTIGIVHGSFTQLLEQFTVSCACSFSLKKIVICFDLCKFLLLTYLPQEKKKKKILKLYPFHYAKPLSVPALENIPAVITAEMFTKGKNAVINSVVYCKTAPAADPNFLVFLVSTCLSIPRNVKWLSE